MIRALLGMSITLFLFLLSGCEKNDPLYTNIYVDTLIKYDTITIDSIVVDTFFIVDTVNGDTITNDGYEPDNLFLTANKLELDSIQAHLLGKNDVDWFSFAAEAGKLYEISLAENSKTAIYMDLYDPSGVLNVVSNGTTTSNGQYILWKAKESVSYPLSISMRTAVDTGVFTPEMYGIRVRELAIGEVDMYEPNDTKLSATPIVVGGAPLELTYNRNDTDWYSFESDSGKYYEIVMNWVDDGRDLHRRLALYAGKTSSSALKTEYCSNYREEEIIRYYFEGSGTRYINTYSSALQVSSYTLSVRLADMGTPDIYEPDNTLETAKQITLNTPYVHSLTLSDTDYATVEVDSGIVYRVTFDTVNTSGLELLINDSFGDSITTWYSTSVYPTSTYMLFKAQSTDTYHLRYTHTNSNKFAIKEYTYRVVPLTDIAADIYEPDDSPALGKPLLPGVEAQTHTLTLLDRDCFTVAVTAGKKYTALVTTTEDIYGKLSATYSLDLISSGVDASIYNKKAKLEWTSSYTGTCYLDVRVYFDDKSSYTISLTEE